MTIISDYFWIFKSFFLISLFPSSIVCTLFPERSTWPHFSFVLRMVRRREEIFQELKKVTIETGGKNNTRISGFPTIKMPIFYVVFKSLFATNKTKIWIIIAVPKRIFELVAKIFSKIEKKIKFYNDCLLSNYVPIYLKHNLNEVLKLGK